LLFELILLQMRRQRNEFIQGCDLGIVLDDAVAVAVQARYSMSLFGGPRIIEYRVHCSYRSKERLDDVHTR
jgi:hypothetical protein